MNLNGARNIEQLRELIRRCDDSAGDHVLWVTSTGEVQLSRIAQDQTEIEFQQSHPDLRIQFETFRAGNEYVGAEAAEDEEWLGELFERLLNEWSKAKGNPDVAYLGNL